VLAGKADEMAALANSYEIRFRESQSVNAQLLDRLAQMIKKYHRKVDKSVVSWY
jgi:hypothetical protein